MYFTLCCFSFSKNCFKVTKSRQELQGPASSPWTECGAPEAPGLSLDFSSSPHHMVWRLYVYVCALQEFQLHTVYSDHLHPFPNSSQIQASSTQLFAPPQKKGNPSRSICATHIFHIFLTVWSSAGAGHVFEDILCCIINIFLLLHTACLESSVLIE